MEIIITILVIAVLFVPAYFLIKQEHKKEMEALAADCSKRIQELDRELVIVCTDRDSVQAHKIIGKVNIRLQTEIIKKIK